MGDPDMTKVAAKRRPKKRAPIWVNNQSSF